jgi:hypothetical protein
MQIFPADSVMSDPLQNRMKAPREIGPVRSRGREALQDIVRDYGRISSFVMLRFRSILKHRPGSIVQIIAKNTRLSRNK